MEWENVRKEEEEVIFYISRSNYFITIDQQMLNRHCQKIRITDINKKLKLT